MKPLLFTIMMAFVFTPSMKGFSMNHNDTSAIVGRWDITVDVDGKMKPSWLEIRISGHKTLVGQFVGTEGSARPISRLHYENGIMSFSIPPQWEKEPNDLQVVGSLKNGNFEGVMVFSNGKKYSWTANRAPAARRTSTPEWGEPVDLLAGNTLDAWHATGQNQWKIENGVLSSPRSGSNLVTNEKFNDFKLHLEFKYPKGSNSGVYLRGRYEVQIIDSKGMEPSDILFGGVYGFLTPGEMAAKDAGEWQSMDITLIGRMVTIEANGKTVIHNQAIPGITGGALDSHEGEPGPLMLQGDHGPIEFRNIVITPAK